MILIIEKNKNDMNKKGNMYEWVTGTWNPLAGKCPHGCVYCSTHKLMRYPVIQQKYTGEIRLDIKAMCKNLGKNKTWFVAAQNDLFAAEVKGSMIHEVLRWCKMFDNTYLFQTKNPERYFQFLKDFPEKTILCTTIETNRLLPALSNAPATVLRSYAMRNIHKFRKFVTIEPIVDFDLMPMVEIIKECNPEQVNIGADSGHNNLPEPSKEKLLALISELQKFTVIANKSNLERLLK